MITALGIMTGTSCDGIDVAIIQTDGQDYIQRHVYQHQAFSRLLSDQLKNLGVQASQKGSIDLTEQDVVDISDAYTKIIANFLLKLPRFDDVELIGFHGQTVLHQPHLHRTFQLGNPQLLSNMTSKKVVFDFRSQDMQHQGQGAPLVPLYHIACVKNLEQPVTFVNIGGVSNVTYCNRPFMGFDIGPGNSISDDLCREFFGVSYDPDGRYAGSGQVNFDIVKQLAQSDIFLQVPPKSFDRNQFDVSALKKLAPVDAVATANYLTAYLIIQADMFYPAPVKTRIISGGGVRNKTLMKNLTTLSTVPVLSAEQIALNSEAIEAECFAWLAVRSLFGLPLSEPSITGATQAVSGGKLYYPE